MEAQNDHERLVKLEMTMTAHEVQCEERWKTTFNRLEDIDSGITRINSKLMIGLGSAIIFLAGVVVTLVTRGLA